MLLLTCLMLSTSKCQIAHSILKFSQDFRQRVRAAEEKRQNAKERNGGNGSEYNATSPTSSSSSSSPLPSSNGHEINSDIYSGESGNGGGGYGGQGGGGGQGSGQGGGLRGMGLGESKIQYVRHMVYQYLTCKDAIVKPHIESALVALFRYNELERSAIDEQRKVDTEDTITSITNYLGLFTT